MRIAVCLLAVTLGLSAAPVEDTIKDKLTKFAAAAKAGDEKALNLMLSNDLVYSHSSGKEQNKQEVVSALVHDRKGFVHSNAKIRVYGDTAVVNVQIHMEESKSNLTSLQIWVRNGNDWQMVARQATAVMAANLARP
jgi:ketosteroid isomerase-like protein